MCLIWCGGHNSSHSAPSRVLVSPRLQVRSCRPQLGETGGAMGVRLLTLDDLYAECLDAAGEVYTRLSGLELSARELTDGQRTERR